ncbi:hypothetical protein CDD83_8804 [Cordyceps sp. RAO-2017]|nr:hypothetical protein CDD83_8804 [Cordyceps sp. RAO-2017]
MARIPWAIKANVLFCAVLWFLTTSGVFATPIVRHRESPPRVLSDTHNRHGSIVKRALVKYNDFKDKRLYVALYLRSAEKPLGHEKYHWALLAAPNNARPDEKVWQAFDAANPDARKANDWELQVKPKVDPKKARSLITRIEVSALRDTISDVDLQNTLREVPLPDSCKNPFDSCVTWALGGLKKLQDKGYIKKFDVDNFSQVAFDFANGQIDKLSQIDLDEGEALLKQISHYDPQKGKIVPLGPKDKGPSRPNSGDDIPPDDPGSDEAEDKLRSQRARKNLREKTKSRPKKPEDSEGPPDDEGSNNDGTGSDDAGDEARVQRARNRLREKARNKPQEHNDGENPPDDEGSGNDGPGPDNDDDNDQASPQRARNRLRQKTKNKPKEQLDKQHDNDEPPKDLGPSDRNGDAERSDSASAQHARSWLRKKLYKPKTKPGRESHQSGDVPDKHRQKRPKTKSKGGKGGGRG